jgi:hypothetical protein
LHWFRYDHEKSTLQISENLARAAEEAQMDDGLRQQPQTYNRLVRTLTDYAYRQISHRLEKVLENFQNGKGLLEEPDITVTSPSTVSSWFSSMKMAVLFQLMPSVYSEHIRPLPLDGWWCTWSEYPISKCGHVY